MRFLPFSRLAPTSRRRARGPRLRAFDPQHLLFTQLASPDEPDGDELHPQLSFLGDLRELLGSAGWTEEEIDRLLLLLRFESATVVADLLDLAPGSVSRLRDRLLRKAWLTVLALLVRRAVEEQSGGVVDPRCGSDVPHAHPDDACPVSPGVSSGLDLADLLTSVRDLQDVLAEDGVYLCVERQEEGCRLWPGRFPADEEAAVLLPFPALPPADHKRATLRLVA